jgi:alcohol dehydrogenase
MSGVEGWTYHNPVDVHFGAGCWRGAGAGGAPGRLVLLTSAGMARRGTAARVAAEWGAAQEPLLCARVTPNPAIADLEALAGELRPAGGTGLIALGGGSAIDTAKVLAVLLADATADLRALLRGGELARSARPLPVMAVPTTAGTGSEVTPFATVWDGAAKRKHSLASPRLFPRAAFLDPELTVGVPPATAVAAGLDALAQALEAIWNVHANPVTTAHATEAVRIALAALPALAGGNEPGPGQRADLLYASLLAGLAISHTRTALAHAMSYPITAHLGVPHGLACGLALPAVLEFNAAADDGRLARLAATVGCGTAAELGRRLAGLLAVLGIDGYLGKYRVDLGRLAELAPEMIDPARAGNNLRPAGVAEVRGILRAAGGYLPACRDACLPERSTG